MSGIILPFSRQSAEPADPLEPFEAAMMDAAEDLAARALQVAHEILGGEDFDFEAEAQALLRAAIGIIILEQEPGGSDAA
jgi:hypothetical protein